MLVRRRQVDLQQYYLSLGISGDMDRRIRLPMQGRDTIQGDGWLLEGLVFPHTEILHICRRDENHTALRNNNGNHPAIFTKSHN